MALDATQKALKQLSLGLAVLGLGGGFLAAAGVLNGDSQGQVNLLFLLLLFAFLPVVGLGLSLLLLARGGGKGLAGWLLDIPIWPRHLTLALPQLNLFHGREFWFFYQTQIFSLCFAFGALLVYLLLLLATDISFVWRSTLLEPNDLLPILQAIALPWSFWSDAQPSLALIEQTRDFRVGDATSSSPIVGLWWQYIFAAQLFYNIVPRSIMLAIAHYKYSRRLRGASTNTISQQADSESTGASHAVTLAQLVHSVKIPYVILDWAITPASCIADIQQTLGAPQAIDTFGPMTPLPVHNKVDSLVVLVRSWEPPLGELADRLLEIETNGDKLILPVDWTQTRSLTPTHTHLEEWQRFAATLNDWKVLSLESSI